MVRQQMPGQQIRVPVLEAPTVQRVDVSSGLYAAADAAREIETAIQDAHDANMLLEKRSEITNTLETAREENAKLPLPERDAHWLKVQQDIMGKVAPTKGSPRVYLQLRGETDRMLGAVSADVKHQNLMALSDHNIAQADDTNARLMRQAASAKTPQERKIAVDAIVSTNSTLQLGGFITEGKMRARNQAALEELDIVSAKRAIKANPLAAKKAFDSPDNYVHLSPAQILALKEDADREARDQRSAFLARAEGVVTGEQVRINRFANGQGEYSQADLDRMKGTIGVDAFNRLQMQYDDARRGVDQRVSEVSGSLQAVQSGRPLDPKSNDDRKAVDLVWGANSATMPEDQRLDGLVQFSKRVGMVPEQGKKMIRGSLRSANDQQVMAGVELVGRLKNENPALLDDFSKEDVRIALSVLSQTEAGVKPEEALKRYREGLTLSDAVKDVRVREFSDEVKSNPGNAVNALRRATGGEASWGALLGGRWVSDADVPPEAVEEFHRVAREEYARTGNMDSANKFAAESLRRVYGVSELSGGRAVTRYAPEQWYGNRSLSASDNAQWIREQAMSEATTVLGHAPEGTLSLVPARRVGDDGRPAYIVNITKPDGTIVTPERNGKPLMFVPDFKQSPAAKQLQDKNTGKIKAAKDARQFELDTVNAPRGLGL
jgi:hypothetical protein